MAAQSPFLHDARRATSSESVQQRRQTEDMQCSSQVAADDVENDSNGEEDGKEGDDGRFRRASDSNRWCGTSSSQLPSANTVVDALVLALAATTTATAVELITRRVRQC